jgi:hypothetical protein
MICNCSSLDLGATSGARELATGRDALGLHNRSEPALSDTWFHFHSTASPERFRSDARLNEAGGAASTPAVVIVYELNCRRPA